MKSDAERERREFLEQVASLGGAAGVAAFGLSGCLSSGPRAGLERRWDELLASRMETLDAALAELADLRLIRAFVTDGAEGELPPELDAFLDECDDTMTGSLRALMLTAAVLDLPEEARGSGEVRQRLDRHGEELDAAVVEQLRILRSCPAENLGEIEAVLEDEPDLVMRLCEMMDRWGRPRGLGPVGARTLRAAARRCTHALREQPLAEVVDGCLELVEESLAEHGVDRRRLERCSSNATDLWRDLERASVAKASAKEVGESASEEREELPCVTELDDGSYFVSPECPHTEAELPEIEPSSEDESSVAWEGYQAWRDSSRRVRHHRQGRTNETPYQRRRRRGRGVLIAGGITFIVCGIGLFLIIIGAAMMGSAARRWRDEHEWRQREQR